MQATVYNNNGMSWLRRKYVVDFFEGYPAHESIYATSAAI